MDVALRMMRDFLELTLVNSSYQRVPSSRGLRTDRRSTACANGDARTATNQTPAEREERWVLVGRVVRASPIGAPSLQHVISIEFQGGHLRLVVDLFAYML